MAKYEFRKVRRQTKCSCGQTMKLGTHLIGLDKMLMCLNCGNRQLLEHKTYYKKKIAEINRCLRKIRRHPKEMVVAKLNPIN